MFDVNGSLSGVPIGAPSFPFAGIRKPCWRAADSGKQEGEASGIRFCNPYCHFRSVDGCFLERNRCLDDVGIIDVRECRGIRSGSGPNFDSLAQIVGLHV